MSFFVYVIFFFQFRITCVFRNVLFYNIRKLVLLIIFLDLLSLLICFVYSFDYYLVLTSLISCLLLACLLTLRWRININILNICLFFHSLPILTNFFRLPPLPVYFDLSSLLKLTKLTPPFIRHLRVISFSV